jgi:ribosomal protein L12E/L44/L45/RPP1/RPP2
MVDKLQKIWQDYVTLGELRFDMEENIKHTVMLISIVILKELELSIKKQNPFVQIWMAIEHKRLEKEIMQYIVAVFFLSFVGKKVTIDSIKAVRDGLGLSKSDKFLNFITTIGFKDNVIAYVPAIYFLKFNKMSIDVDNVMEIIKAMDLVADSQTAKYVIELYQEFLYNEGETVAGRRRFKSKNTPVLEHAIAFTQAAARAMGIMMISELDRAFENGQIEEEVRKGFARYLIAMETLAFSGEESGISGNEKFLERVGRLVGATGALPDKSLLDYLSSFNYGYSGGFHYIPAIGILESIGKEPDIDNIKTLMNAVGMPVDDALVGFVLTTYMDTIVQQFNNFIGAENH